MTYECVDQPVFIEILALLLDSAIARCLRCHLGRLEPDRITNFPSTLTKIIHQLQKSVCIAVG